MMLDLNQMVIMLLQNLLYHQLLIILIIYFQIHLVFLKNYYIMYQQLNQQSERARRLQEGIHSFPTRPFPKAQSNPPFGLLLYTSGLHTQKTNPRRNWNRTNTKQHNTTQHNTRQDKTRQDKKQPQPPQQQPSQRQAKPTQTKHSLNNQPKQKTRTRTATRPA